jgi:hypothetical protein
MVKIYLSFCSAVIMEFRVIAALDLKRQVCSSFQTFLGQYCIGFLARLVAGGATEMLPIISLSCALLFQRTYLPQLI